MFLSLCSAHTTYFILPPIFDLIVLREDGFERVFPFLPVCLFPTRSPERVGMTGAEKRTKAMEDEGGDGGMFFFCAR